MPPKSWRRNDPLAPRATPHAPVRQQIGGRERALRAFNDLRASAIGVLLAQGEQFLAHNAEDLGVIGQQPFQIGDTLPKFLMLVLQLLALQRGQPSQGHIQNRLGLHLREAEAAHQVCTRRLHTLAAANRLDDLVQDVQRLEQTFDNMRPGPGPGQVVLRAAADDLLAVLDEEKPECA